MKKQWVKIIIGGDVCPVGRAMDLFAQGDARKIFTNTLDVFQQAQVAVVNLECSFIDSQAKPIMKDGPNLGLPEKCIAGIKNAGITGVNLANNHIYDYGPDGLNCTISACERAGVFHFGAGRNLQEANNFLRCFPATDCSIQS